MIIFRYICRELYTSLLAILLVMLVIFMTNQFVHLLDKAANGEITVVAVLKIMSLQIPLLLGYLLPLSFYLAILLVFGRLHMDNEMTVLSACGMSRAQLLGTVMVLATALMLLVAWLMIWVEPVMEKYQFKIYGDSIASATIAKVAPKRFQSLGPEGVLYAQDIVHQQMREVFLAVHKDNNWDVTIAKQAAESTLAGQADQYLTFIDGNRYVGIPGQEDYQVMHFAKYGVRLLSAVPTLGGGMLTVPTSELWPQRNKNVEAAAIIQWRLALPISVLIFPLLAFPLSQVNPRRGRFMRLFPAMLIYIGYADLLFLGRAWIINGTLVPHFGLWIIHAALLLLAIILFFTHIGWRQILPKKLQYAHS